MPNSSSRRASAVAPGRQVTTRHVRSRSAVAREGPPAPRPANADRDDRQSQLLHHRVGLHLRLDGAPAVSAVLAWGSIMHTRGEGRAMAQYKLHCFCQSGNSYKVALYLNCAGLDWEPVFVDFLNGATRDAQVARERQRDGRGAGAGGWRASKLSAVGRDPDLPGREDRQVRARGRGRAARGAALDAVRQPQVHELLRHLPLPEVAGPAGARSRRAGLPQGPLRRRVGDRRQAPRPSRSSWSATSRPSPTSRSPATCSTPSRSTATTGPRPIPTSTPGSSACARCRAGRTPTS